MYFVKGQWKFINNSSWSCFLLGYTYRTVLVLDHVTLPWQKGCHTSISYLCNHLICSFSDAIVTTSSIKFVCLPFAVVFWYFIILEGTGWLFGWLLPFFVYALSFKIYSRRAIQTLLFECLGALRCGLCGYMNISLQANSIVHLCILTTNTICLHGAEVLTCACHTTMCSYDWGIAWA